MEHEPPLLARNPAAAFKKRLPKVERKDLVTLTPEQSNQLLAALQHSRMYWSVLIALATGMRRGEICAPLLALGICQGGDTLVCGKANGTPHLLQSITFEFNRSIERLALPRVTFHGLRHGHATQLLASGVHPKIAQERVGHSTISTTLDLYSHVTDTMQPEAAEKLNAVWLGSKLGSNEPQAAKDAAKR